MLTLSSITTSRPSAHPPEHHIAPVSAREAGWAAWTSYLPSWAPEPGRARPALNKGKPAGFRNPWSSWHKPTLAELWGSFQWGEDADPCIELAASHLADTPPAPKPPPSRRPRFSDIDSGWSHSRAAQAARLLRVDEPDLSFPAASDSNVRAKATWLGHACLLVQLPSLSPKSRPVRCLFDPMFSERCSPTQSAGPIRSYPPPCRAEHLPQIDAVFISHNHYDHMDYDSIMAVWRASSPTVRFFVPLQNKPCLLDWGIPSDRIVEMDWFDSARLTHPDSTGADDDAAASLKVWCTPAQHNSYRSGVDTDSSLWSGWYLEHLPPAGKPPYRVFFAGDTGYQFHPSPEWPPSPPAPAGTTSPGTEGGSSSLHKEEEEETKDDHVDYDDSSSDGDNGNGRRWPACPAFAEIRRRIGPPDLMLLPVWVGATYDYLRSFVPLPDAVSPFPRHGLGVSAANHMPPWDAVRVLKVLTEGGGGGGGDGVGEAAVAVAMHWGTFVTDPVEVLKTLGQLEWACRRHGVRFARSWPPETEKVDDEPGSGTGPCFVALNHGQSVCV